MSEQVKIGQLIDSTHKRDAIHVAIYPIQAVQDLLPGQVIDLVVLDGRNQAIEAIEAEDAKGLGIVDPFLPDPIKKGEWFYMFLYPNTVTGMRHQWEHPAIAFEDEQAEEFVSIDEIRTRITGKGVSEKWLMEYAIKYNIYLAPDKAYRKLLDDIKGGSDITFKGTGMNGFEDLPDPDELRKHAEIVLGIKVDWHNYEFSCSC